MRAAKSVVTGFLFCLFFFTRYLMVLRYTVSGLLVQRVNPTVVSQSLQWPSTQPLYLHSRNITVRKFSVGRTTITSMLYYWWKSSPPLQWARSSSFTGFLDHTHDAPQSVRLLWTSDQLVAETSTWQHTTLTPDKHPCPRSDSNPQSQQASGHRPTP